MVVLGRGRNAKVQPNAVQEWWLGQHDTACTEIRANCKLQTVGACLQRVMGNQESLRVAAIGIDQPLHQCGAVALRAKQGLPLPAAGWPCMVSRTCVLNPMVPEKKATLPKVYTPWWESLSWTAWSPLSTLNQLHPSRAPLSSNASNPGTKLAEQKLADQYGVSRTLVRQALFPAIAARLVRMEPARGAFVAASVVEEAPGFAVRRMLEWA